LAKKTAVDAIIARLKANFTLAPVLDRNVTTQTPADGSSWVRIEFPVSSNTMQTLDHEYREDGGFRVVVATALGDGLATSNMWCEQIATIFRGQKFDGVQCWAPTIREGVDDGSYFISTVVVPYWFSYSD
jgi:hypothetical protein